LQTESGPWIFFKFKHENVLGSVHFRWWLD
jgi:hypothetical protein